MPTSKASASLSATMPAHPRYWRNIGLAAGLALLIGGGIVALFVVWSIVHFAEATLHPARRPIDATPHGAAYENVTFITSDGITLRGWYLPATNGAAVILAHGYGNNRLDLLPEADLLADQGYGVLLFDFRGHGASDDALVTIGDHERRDLAAALDFIAARDEVDPDRIGAVGFSMGAATLAQVAADDDRLRAVVLEAAFSSLETTIRHEARLLGPFSQLPSLWTIRRAGVDVDDVRPVDDLCAISPRPVFLIYGDQDEVIAPGTPATMFEVACEPVERWLIEGAGHQNFTQAAPETYPARLLAFFDQWLR